MTRRSSFERYSPLLRSMATFAALFPRSWSEALLQFFRFTSGRVGLALRYALIKRLAAACGGDVAIFPGVFLTYSENLRVGGNVSIHEYCNIGCFGGLTVGDNVMISQGTSILTTEHDYKQTETPMKEAPLIAKSVEISSDVWIGAHCVLTAGVSIGPGAVIGAGAVVTHDVPGNVVAAGVPARVISRRTSA